MKNSILIQNSDPPSHLLGSYRLYGFMNERMQLNLRPLDCFQNFGSYVAVPVGIKTGLAIPVRKKSNIEFFE